MRKGLFGVAFCLGFAPGFCLAEDLESEIQRARRSGDWSAAAALVKARADGGDLAYQTAFGEMHVSGLGVARDPARAVALFRLAAEKNFAPAQSNLGYMYGTGTGVERDARLAADWYAKAAAQGFAEGQYNLGYIYHSGALGAADEKAALEWYAKAAEQRFARAWLNMGVLYLQGRETAKDPAKALAFFRQAADAGETPAQMNAANLYLTGNGVQADPVLAYYYLLLAGSRDSRGPCVPPAIWIAARLERDSKFTAPAEIIRQELQRQSCMVPDPRAPGWVEKLDSLAPKYPEIGASFKKARAAANEFLERRKALDEPKGASPVAYRGEQGFFKSFPHWVISASPQRSGDTVASEMRPPGETGEDWSRAVRYRQTFNAKHPEPRAGLEPYLADLRKACAVALVEEEIFSGVEGGYRTHSMSVYCARNARLRSELHFFKAVQGDASYYVFHGIWRGKPDARASDPEATSKASAEFARWLAEQVVCDTSLREGARACPPGLPIPAPRPSQQIVPS